MKITNFGVGNPTLPSQSAIDATSAAGNSATPATTAVASNAYAPSPELQRLIDGARAEPAVREDRIQAALARLNQGYYHTPASIDETAQSMLKSAD